MYRYVNTCTTDFVEYVPIRKSTSAGFGNAQTVFDVLALSG